jgi:hypothetical protein
VKISQENEKDIQQILKKYSTKTTKICSNKAKFQPQLYTHSRPDMFNNRSIQGIGAPHCYTEVKFGPSDTRREGEGEDLHQSRCNFSEEQPGTPLVTTKGMKKFWKS